MNGEKKAETRLRRTFADVHRKKGQVKLDAAWQRSLLDHIRRIGPLEADGPPFSPERLVWRFTAVAATIAVLLSGYAVGTGLETEWEVASMFLEQPLDNVAAYLELV